MIKLNPFKSDDPSRVADLGFYKEERGEQKPVNPEVVFLNVIEAIRYEESVYGMSARDLEDFLIDSILGSKEDTMKMLEQCGELEGVLNFCKNLAEGYYDGGGF